MGITTKTEITIPNGMRVLVVEDNCERINWFKDQLHNVAIASNLKDAQYALEYGVPFDVIFLDHDAGWKGNKQLSFFPVAERLAELKYHGQVFLHSLNTSGRHNMAVLLRKTAYVQQVPFGSFELKREGFVSEDL